MSAIYKKFAPILGREDGATPHIPDPMLDNDISWNWERSHFETFMNRVKEAEETATKALETDDQEEAVRQWQKLFGEVKVKGITQNLTKVSPGIASITSVGIVGSQTPTTGRVIVSKPTTYYGEE
jgi:hypothetical protein